MSLDAVLSLIDAEEDRALARLFALLRTRSISTDPAYAGECRKAADWLAADLASMGFDAAAHPTEGHPIVLAEDLSADGPHVLFYGHYDVQPVDPLDLWESDPFEPKVVTRDDGSKYVFGRGTSDDKGQLMTFLEACRAWKGAAGRLPCKVTILLEGEEESGGENLPVFLEQHRERLGQAGIALVCDTNMWDADTPAICTQLRGMVAEELTLTAANRDLHSGYYGGIAANPIHELSRILADLHDSHGKVTIPGFYDGVDPVPAEIAAQWDGLGYDVGAFLASVGLKDPAGEDDQPPLHLTWARPTCEVNGIWGGYTGAGFKTVIPGKAHAKISFRLVGRQDPEAVRKGFRQFVTERLRPDCSVAFTGHGVSPATVMPTSDPRFETARRALSEEWGTEAAFIGAGGSIPIVGDFTRILGLDTMLIGFALDDDRIHSPNEKYELRSFQKGVRSWARVLDALAG